MQLNEIIEENSLPTISQRTRISVGNLEAIINRDWGRLKKVQALGFLSILEREYGIDLSDLKAECKAHFEAMPSPHEENPPLIITAAEPSLKSGTKVVLVVAALLAAGGGWMAFVSSDRNATEVEAPSPEKNESSGSFYDSVLSMAKGWFGQSEPSIAEMQEAGEVPALNEAWAAGNATTGEESPAKASTDGSPEAETPKRAEESAEEQNGSPDKEEARIIRQVKQEQAKAEELRQKAAQEGNASPEKADELEALSKMLLAPSAAEPAQDAEEKKEEAAREALAPEVPSLREEQTLPAEEKLPEPPAEEEPQAETAPDETAPPAQEPKKPAAAAAGPVIFHPRAKIWVGYTNLRTKKRTAKVTTQEITFDTAEGDYILATGHGQIDFKTPTGEKSFNDGKRHFFMIAKGGVREISHEEFQRLNKSKVW